MNAAHKTPIVRHGVAYTDMWTVYLAVVAGGDSKCRVRIGITTLPVGRVADIQKRSPSPVVAAKWAAVPSKAIAYCIESRIKKALADRSLGDGWFEFDYSSETDKSRLNDVVTLMFRLETRASPQWVSVNAKSMMKKNL